MRKVLTALIYVFIVMQCSIYAEDKEEKVIDTKALKVSVQTNLKESILIKTLVFRCNGNLSGDTSLQEDIFENADKPSVETKRAITPFTNAELVLAGKKLSANNNEWKYDNNTPIDFALAKDKTFTDNNMKLIAAPSIKVNNKEEAEVSIQSNQKIEYFEKRADGLFETKNSDEVTGLMMKLTAEKINKEKIKLSDFIFSMKSVEKRLPIEGISLDVGKPVLVSREFKLNMTITSGKNYGILLFPGDGQGFILIKFNAENVTGQNAEKEKSNNEK